MKRRHFLSSIPVSVAGISLASSCSNQEKGNSSSSEPTGQEQTNASIPEYRSKIKSTFTVGSPKSANDKVIIALIGAGGWGSNLIMNIARINKNVHVKYICDVDDTRGGRAISELGKIQGTKPERVRDMRKVYDDPEVDGVIVATPQHWHALATIWACQAGKDVYVEKCISLTIPEGQKMIEAAMKYERVIQCGTQNRSAKFAFSARDYLKSGQLGQIVAVNVYGLVNGPIPFIEKPEERPPDTIDWDMWLGPAPKVPYSVSRNKSHQFYWDYAVGLGAGDIHQMDLARLVLDNPDFPESVYCAGGRYNFDDNRDTQDYQMVTFDYGEFVLSLQSGQFTPYMVKSSLEIRNGDGFPEWKQNATKIVIYGTEAMMYVGRMGGGWQVFDKDQQIVAQDTGRFPLQVHLGNFIDCIRSREQPNGNIIEGHKSASLIHLANLSYRTGKKQLSFSDEFETILNNQEAHTLSLGTYRKGYELPEVV